MTTIHERVSLRLTRDEVLARLADRSPGAARPTRRFAATSSSTA